MAEGLRIIAVCFVDVFVGVLLFVLACILGSALQHALTPDVDFYLFWFMVALLPFFQYAKWRKVMNFDAWDVVIYGVTFSFATLLAEALPQVLESLKLMLKITAFVFAVSRWEQFRETKFPRPEQRPAKTI